jgi:hypothetical protein
VNVPGTELRDFWPRARLDPPPKKVDAAGDRLRVVFDGKPSPDDQPFGGLVIASENGKDAFFELEAPSPDAEADAKSPPRAKAKTKATRRR